jgi:hypothetical protein
MVMNIRGMLLKVFIHKRIVCLIGNVFECSIVPISMVMDLRPDEGFESVK